MYVKSLKIYLDFFFHLQMVDYLITKFKILLGTTSVAQDPDVQAMFLINN